ncbi:smoothelin-like protein 1 isoform X1 [Octodon degus]|uniref:Smoothelin-like protein 1 isoform X1 n=1 Tax=Octodon degus TaxID=10160 RepID=A0A6P6DPA4_OCTDE|nr:smoothelin-like protein 1 isoform X1 [Octodon degus]XP_023561874.1 smoothelin-like protein 1 isoform X1 [Octodon degus]
MEAEEKLSKEGTTVSPAAKEPETSGAATEEMKGPVGEPHTKDSVPKDDVPEDDVPKNGVPKDIILKDGVPKDGVSKNGVPKDGVPKNGVPKDSVPKDGVPENGVPENGVPKDSVPKDGVPKNGVPKDSVPKDGVPENGIPEDGIHKDGVPKDGVPKDSVPVDGAPTGLKEEADGLETRVQGESGKEAERKQEARAEPGEEKGRKERAAAEPKEAEAMPAPQRQKVDEEQALGEPEENDRATNRDKPAPTGAGGDQVTEQEAKMGSQKVAMGGEPHAADEKEEAKRSAEELEPGGPGEDQEQGEDQEPTEEATGVPSSPEVWPESPSEEGPSLSPDAEDSAASGDTSPGASECSPGDAPQSPTEPPPAREKEPAPGRRVSAAARPRGPRAQNRKAIVDKFGGAASGPTALFRNAKAAGAAVGGVRSMLLAWCQAMTRKYEHVDIQNFSASWSSGMAFCALIHKFFPDAFDYAALDPAQRRHNFTLAFSTAEKLADCAQLLDVDDMVRLAVPDSKCVYTYIQELYRSLVQKGLVKTKK